MGGLDQPVLTGTAAGGGWWHSRGNEVENYTVMGAKLITVMAVEATSLLPKVEAARDAGILAAVAFDEYQKSARLKTKNR